MERSIELESDIVHLALGEIYRLLKTHDKDYLSKECKHEEFQEELRCGICLSPVVIQLKCMMEYAAQWEKKLYEESKDPVEENQKKQRQIAILKIDIENAYSSIETVRKDFAENISLGWIAEIREQIKIKQYELDMLVG